MKIASIDIGSNTVLMLIAEVDILAKTIKPLANYYEIPRISKGLKVSGNISNQDINALESVFSKYVQLAHNAECRNILAVGTNAMRMAKNSMEIVRKIKNKFNINIRVVSGEEEAYLTFLGATRNSKSSDTFCVLDIGGGSTEVIFGDQNDIKFRQSYDIGVVSSTSEFLLNSPPTENEIQNSIEYVNKTFDSTPLPNIDNSTQYIAVAGTPTTLAAIFQNMFEYDEEKIENYKLSIHHIESFFEQIKTMNADEILERFGSIITGRNDIILAGVIILMQFMERIKIKNINVSTGGVRYGVIVDFLKNHV